MKTLQRLWGRLWKPGRAPTTLTETMEPEGLIIQYTHADPDLCRERLNAVVSRLREELTRYGTAFVANAPGLKVIKVRPQDPGYVINPVRRVIDPDTPGKP